MLAATKSKLDKLHANISDRFRARLGASLGLKVDVGGPEGSRWENVPKNTRLSFWLTNEGERESALHGLSGKPYPVYMLPFARDRDIGPWVGWYEEWVKADERSFDLVGVSLAFYWGSKGHAKKAQILRAEWDNVARRGGNAGQPHWHVDTKLMVDFVIKNRPGARLGDVEMLSGPRGELEELTYHGAELEELPMKSSASAFESVDSAAAQELMMSGMHLAMGGWSNGTPIKHPGRWQCRTDEKAIIEWADSTLEYAIAEFERLVDDEPIML